LIALTAAAALALAIPQIHRQHILRQVEAFKAEGVELWDLDDAWRDFFWQRPPERAILNVKRLDSGEWELAGAKYTVNEFAVRLNELGDKLSRLGVTFVDIYFRSHGEQIAYRMNKRDTVDDLIDFLDDF